MTSAASEAIEGIPPAGGAAPPASAPERGEDLESMMESDTHETRLEYDPTGKLPMPVVLVWICALVGLGAYAVVLYLPDLALWAK
jgi:hypothetical protein